MSGGGGIVKIQHDRERPYVMASKGLTEDKRATFALRGILVYLLGKPPGWSAIMEEIEAASETPGKDGREAIRACFAEGRRLGYIKTVEHREQGRVSYSHTIYETPLNPPIPQIVTVDGKPSAVSRLRQAADGQPLTASRRLVSTDQAKNEEVNINTPLPPEGEGASGAVISEGTAADQNPQTLTPSQPKIDGAQGGRRKRSGGPAKGSGRGAARPPTPELPAEALKELLGIYNAHCGTLPKADELNTGRIKALCRVWSDCGYDLDKTRAVLADATQEVAIDDFWTLRRRYGLDNLLPKVFGRAEAWRNRLQNPAPPVAANRPSVSRRDMTTEQAIGQAAADSAAMLDYLED